MDEKVIWHSSTEALERYRDRMRIPSTEGSLIFPFKALWSFGGFARVLDPGVLVGVVGASGGMKTSFLETVTDAWRQMEPIDILWWGTEWSWEKMADRAIQRYHGSPMQEMSLHTLWLQEEKMGIPEKARHGYPLSENQIDTNDKITRRIADWPGESYQMEKPVTDLEQLLQYSHAQIESLKEVGHHIRVVVFDYLQLLDLWVKASESEKISTVLGKIKVFCIEHKLIGLVASQVTKTSASEMKDPKKPVILEAESGQNFRSDKFNLVLTLNPVFQGRLITDQGVIYVAKNSTGSTGLKTVEIDPSRFIWLDMK